MKTKFLINKKQFLITLIFSFIFSICTGQNVFIDTVAYEGTLKFKKTDFRYKRIISGLGAFNNLKVYNPQIKSPEDETLLIFDKKNKCILDFKLNEVSADHNNANIMTTDCNITDSTLILTRYSFFSDHCDGCSGETIGIEKYTYQINESNELVLKDSLDVSTNNPKQKLKIKKIEIDNFKKVINKSQFLNKLDKRKILNYLK